MKTILLVALGGALGTIARYLVGKIGPGLWGQDFPWATLIVNITGCFIMGVLAGLLTHYTQLSQDVRAFLLVGMLGGFTTFSAFALDFITLYERGNIMAATLYLTSSVVVSIVAVMAGLFLIRNFTA